MSLKRITDQDGRETSHQWEDEDNPLRLKVRGRAITADKLHRDTGRRRLQPGEMLCPLCDGECVWPTLHPQGRWGTQSECPLCYGIGLFPRKQFEKRRRNLAAKHGIRL